jgi:aquaporin TIP
MRALEAPVAVCAASFERLGVERLAAVRASTSKLPGSSTPFTGLRVPRTANRHAFEPSDRLRSLPALDHDILRRGVAEFVGTFTLIFIGGGAGAVAASAFGVGAAYTLVAFALANGLAIGIMVSNLGHISGGHFNPAITAGFLATRRIEARIAGVYWLFQLGGAVVAGLILRWLFKKPAILGAVPQVAHGFPVSRALVLEMILTFFLVWAVFATAVDERGAFKAIAGLAIGLTITIDVFVGGPITGAAMNPARALGPEVAANFWAQGWIYWVGPIVGALVAALGYEYLYLRPTRPPVVGTPESGVDEPRPGETALS